MQISCYSERRPILIRKIEQKLNNEYYPVKFKILPPDIMSGRCDFEIIGTAKVSAKPIHTDWKTQTIESHLRIDFEPSAVLAKAFARDMFVKIHTIFNGSKTTKRIMKVTKTGITTDKVVTELKYEDWKLLND